MSERDFVIIGGDMRMCHCARFLTEWGFGIGAFANAAAGSLKGVAMYSGLEEAMSASGNIVFGIPFAKDGVVSAPLCNCTITAESIANLIKPHHFIMAGMPGEFKTLCETKGAVCVDYGAREDFCLLNAVPTAEAVIEILIKKLPVTLWESKILIMGYGRIGKILAQKLSYLGAEVTVTARKNVDFAKARAEGIKCVQTSADIQNGREYTVVINTIPQKILTEKSFSQLRSDCLVVDVSAYPGYVLPEEGAVYGVEVVGAFGLPGKTAPVTAGESIATTIRNTKATKEYIL